MWNFAEFGVVIVKLSAYNGKQPKSMMATPQANDLDTIVSHSQACQIMCIVLHKIILSLRPIVCCNKSGSGSGHPKSTSYKWYKVEVRHD